MFRLIAWVLLAALALALGPRFIGEKGYVLFSFSQHSVEMTLVSFGVMFFAFFAGFLLVEWLIKKLFRVMSGSTTWFRGFASSRSTQAWHKGLAAYLLEDWQAANRYFAKVGSHAEYSHIATLYRAKVAAKLQDVEQVTASLNSLNTSELSNNNDKQNHTLIQVDVHNQMKQYQEAHDLLTPLDKKLTKNTSALRALVTSHLGLQQYTAIFELLPNLEKAKVYSDGELTELKQNVYLNGLRQLIIEKDFSAAEQQWNRLPKKDKTTPVYLACWLTVLAEQHKDSEVDTLLTGIVKQSTFADFTMQLAAMSRCATPNTIKLTEKKLLKLTENTQEHSELLMFLGVLAFLNQNYDLARKALQPMESKLPNVVMKVLADSLHQTQDVNTALSVYQKIT